VAEKPIIFNEEMVKAILDGRKTQTRRMVKNSPVTITELDGTQTVHDNYQKNCPFGKIGDRLWVRENFKVTQLIEGCHGNCTTEACSYCECNPPSCIVEYEDGTTQEIELGDDDYIDWLSSNSWNQAERAFKKKKVPSIHMPRWASRIDLEITNVRVERLNNISEDDAEAEGVYAGSKGKNWHGDLKGAVCISKFKTLWNSIYKNWYKNPWVWVVEFKLIEQ
jgi:hypothetical protein